MAGRKRGEMEIRKFKYLENKKSFLDQIKIIFQFLKDYHLVKNKNLLKNSGRKLRILKAILIIKDLVS